MQIFVHIVKWGAYMYSRLENLCNKKKISITALCVKVTGSSGNLSTWKKGYMRSDYLSKCADILDCSVDYLLGRPADGITAEERQLLEHFRACSDDDKKYIRRLASTFAAEEVAEKAKREG